MKELPAHFEPKQAKELGDWESWFTPLKHNWKTHYLRLKDKEYTFYMRYVPGDFLEIRQFDEEWSRLRDWWDFQFVRNLLGKSSVEKSFVRKEEVEEDSEDE